MRDYGTAENLGRAAGLSAVVTVMALGRLAQGNLPLSWYAPLTFLSMTLVAGAITAWGTKAGMPGVVTDRSTCLHGMAIALGLALVAIAAYALGADSAIRHALQDPSHRQFLELTYPQSLGGRLSLVLWSGGVQVIFLVAAPMSLFARLTRNRWAAAALCLALRAYVVHQQVTYAGMEDGVSAFMVSSLLFTAAECFLFARYGLAPAMLFAAAAELHLFLG